MNNKEALSLKTWQAVSLLTIIGFIVGVTGWGWWKGIGPFKEKEPEKKKFHRMEGVEYITPLVRTGAFTFISSPRQWIAGKENYPEWKGKEISSLMPMPYFPDSQSYPYSKQELAEIAQVNKIKQELNIDLLDVIYAEGFHSLPYSVPQQKTVDQVSAARLDSIIKTHKYENRVVFQIETSIHRYIRADFKNPTLLDVVVTTQNSSPYIVDEKDVAQAIKEVFSKEVQRVLHSVCTDSTVSPYDQQIGLPANPAVRYVLPK